MDNMAMEDWMMNNRDDEKIKKISSEEFLHNRFVRDDGHVDDDFTRLNVCIEQNEHSFQEGQYCF